MLTSEAWRQFSGDNKLTSDAQADSRRAYVGVEPSVATAELIWLVTKLLQLNQGVSTAFAALFLGGILILPAAKLVC